MPKNNEKTGGSGETLILERRALEAALRKLKRHGFCDHPKCHRIAQRIGMAEDWSSHRYCEEHAREMAQLFKNKNGKPLLWFRIRDEGEGPTVKDRFAMVIEDFEWTSKNAWKINDRAR